MQSKPDATVGANRRRRGGVIFATLNRWGAAILLAIGLAVAAFGVFFGIFAWMNDGAVAGVRLLGTTLAFGLGLAAAGLALRWAAAAHASGHPRRWAYQALAVAGAYMFVGLAAWTTALIDRATGH